MNYMSLKDHVYDYISENIKDGSLKPGDKINEQHLSDKLNVSRTPVREALIQLAAEGLLEAEPRRGFRVKPLILEEAKDLYQLIGHLDAMAATLSLDNMTKEDIKLMKSLQVQMSKEIESQDFDKYYKLQIDFHNVYLRKCSNKQLITMLEQLKMRFIKRGYSDKDSDRLSDVFHETNSQHSKIIELFESKDAKALEEFLKEKHWSIDYADLDVV
ncbi:GntR family transcriptional regulator [Proteocatella sphenisci]|uniref:GntR family transcriptional regulator n=1 Tax=Proteocatella sphenisci TaxID=181070 RepID=UPI000490C187|nr:GntR family transcriptional regulator [Proteocatella sphenisci]